MWFLHLCHVAVKVHVTTSYNAPHLFKVFDLVKTSFFLLSSALQTNKSCSNWSNAFFSICFSQKICTLCSGAWGRGATYLVFHTSWTTLLVFSQQILFPFNLIHLLLLNVPIVSLCQPRPFCLSCHSLLCVYLSLLSPVHFLPQPVTPVSLKLTADYNICNCWL